MNPDGAPAAGPVAMITNYGGYDSLGIAYNVRADTFFAVVHGRAPSTFPQEDVGAEMSGVGVPSVEFDVTVTGNKLGNFYPRIAASTARNEWMMVTSTGVRGRQRAAHQDAGQRRRAAAASAAPAAADRADRPDRAERQLVPGRRRRERHADRVPHVLPGRQRARRSGRRARVVRRRQRRAEVPGVHRGGAQPRHHHPASAAGVGSFGSIFQSTTPGRDIFVARSIYWGPNFEGSTGVSAAKSLSTNWYFAEGSRGGELFDNFFLIFNPLPTPTTVGVTFLTAAGQVIPGSTPSRREAADAARQRHPRARRQGLQHHHHRGDRRRRRAGDVLAADRRPRPVVGRRRGQRRRDGPADGVGVRRRRGGQPLRLLLPAPQPERGADHGAGRASCRKRACRRRRS